MQTVISKWGNSLALRLPRNVAEDARLHLGVRVDLQVEGDRLVVTPARPKYRLEELLAQLTPEHREQEVDWGEPVGEEKW